MGFFAKRVKNTKKTVSDAMELGIFMSVFGMVKDIFLTVFMPWKRGEPGQAESFEEATRRLRLTEQDLEERKRMFLQQTLIYVVTGLLVMGYGVYLAFQHEIISMVLAFMVSGLAFSYAFRSHFWLFQVRQKRLGCTFKNYLDSSWKE